MIDKSYNLVSIKREQYGKKTVKDNSFIHRSITLLMRTESSYQWLSKEVSEKFPNVLYKSDIVSSAVRPELAC